MELKQSVVLQVIQKLEGELSVLSQAARTAHEAATHEESKPEDQYDTRGLEASYLASAQAKRAEEIQAAVIYFKNAELRSLRLLTVEIMKRKQHYLIASLGGGISVQVGEQAIQVLTPDSPLGGELAERQMGESFEVEIRETSRTYRVLSAE